jgi:transcriptional regulator with GAF, ATPase, and Fis domain
VNQAGRLSSRQFFLKYLDGYEWHDSLPLNAPRLVAPLPDCILTDWEFRLKERANLVAALGKTAGRVSGEGGTAELLGVKARTLASRVKAFKIVENEWRGQE